MAHSKKSRMRKKEERCQAFKSYVILSSHGYVNLTKVFKIEESAEAGSQKVRT